MPPYQPPYVTRGTTTELIPTPSAEELAQRELKRKKAECKANGGVWDDAAQVCRFPLEKQLKDFKVQPELMKEQTQVDTEFVKGKYDPQRGGFVAESGAFYPTTNPDFRPKSQVERRVVFNKEGTVTMMGADGKPITLSKEEYETFLGRGGALTSNVQAAQNLPTFETVRIQRLQQLQKLAEQGLLTPQELQAIQGASMDISQALGAGAVATSAGLIGGAIGRGAMAMGGAAIGGAAIGGAAFPLIGAVGGFLIGVRSNLKQQQKEAFAVDQLALTKGERYLRTLITDTNKNPQNAPENIALFYQTLNMIDAAHAKTWKDSQESLNKFLGNDGSPQLAKFDIFDATMRRYYIDQFTMALQRPNPNMNLITAEDLGITETATEEI